MRATAEVLPVTAADPLPPFAGAVELAAPAADEGDEVSEEPAAGAPDPLTPDRADPAACAPWWGTSAATATPAVASRTALTSAVYLALDPNRVCNSNLPSVDQAQLVERADRSRAMHC